MIRSMTGFGNASVEFGNKTISVEIKSVNSKFLDLMFRLPTIYREKEFELRTDLTRVIERGKAEFTITIDSAEAPKKTSINAPLVNSYFKELKGISDQLGIASSDYLDLILKLPDVLNSEKATLDDAEWNAVKSAIEKAIQSFNDFRIREGRALEIDLLEHLHAIESGAKDIEQFEPARIELVRKRLLMNLEEFIQVNNIDRNRLEQELIFYIEKFDISEEKVRLRSHIAYFLNTMKEEISSGKKLGFIGQEIGREINTIGSKANDADMQQRVVVLKDELEKIKEQVLNIL